MKLSLPERFVGRPRTMVWIMAVLGVSLALMVLAVSFLLRATVDSGIREGIDQEAGEVAQFATQGIDPATGQPFATAQRFLEVYVARQSSERGELLVAGWEGQPQLLQVEGRDAAPWEALDPVNQARILEAGTAGVLDSDNAGRITWQNIPVTVGETSGFVAVLEFHRSRDAEVRNGILALTFLALVTLVVVGGVVWWVAGRIGEPTERFTEAVNAYRPGMGLRVPEKGSDEYVRLARIANRMIVHAESAVTNEQRRLGDIADAFGARVDTIAGLVGPAGTGLADAGRHEHAAAELGVLRGAIAKIAHLNVVARQREVERQPGVDVREVVVAAVSAWFERPGRPLRPEVHVIAIGDKPVVGACDPAALTEALHEVIDNAVDASADGGLVRVGAYRGRTADGATVEVAVMDAGRGVPEGEREAVLDRFVVASNDPEPGAGLGLTLARALAQGQGGSVVVEEPHQGPGTVVRIQLPLTPPEPGSGIRRPVSSAG